MPAPRSVFVLCMRVLAHAAWHPWSSGYDVSPTRRRSPVRSWQGVLPGCWHISQAWSGSRRQVAALAASQATGTDIETAAVLQRADAASRPKQNSSEPARHPPAPWADAAAICAWGVLGLGRQTHARHLLCAGAIASTQVRLIRWPPAWWATVAAMM